MRIFGLTLAIVCEFLCMVIGDGVIEVGIQAAGCFLIISSSINIEDVLM
jgi:hypothetical protein